MSGGVRGLPVAAAISGAALVWWATARGPGLTPDSLAYLGLAASLGRGEGYTFLGEPNAHFPPLYPVLLVLVSQFVPDPLQGARVLGVALAAANALLAGAVVRAGFGSVWGAGLAACWMLWAPELLAVHAMAWSEALLVTLLLLAVLALRRHAATGTTAALVLAGLSLGLAPLARHAGLALAPALALALARHGTGLARTRRVVALGAMGLAPWSLWGARNAWVSGSVSSRVLAWHPPAAEEFGRAGDAWTRLLGADAPPLLDALVGLASLAALAFATVRAWRRPADGAAPERLVGAALTWSCASSVVLLVAARCLVDADIPFDTRLLFPMAAWAVVAALGSQAARHPAVAALGLLALLAMAPRTLELAADRHAWGMGFETATWTESATLAAARRLPTESRLHSNLPELLAGLADRPAFDIPVRWSRTSLRERPEYGAEVSALCARVRAGTVALVLFDYADWRWQAPSPAELVDACGVEARRLIDGRIVRRELGAR